jgi:large subunit ribosomal protein L24
MKKNNIKSHIKKGDKVVVLSGDSKGEQGVVQKVFPAEYRAIVEGVNLVKRHVRPTAEQPGGINEKEAAIHISNLMLVDENGVASKIRREKRDGKTVRVSKKTQEVI